jgi:hypothetical protein
MSTLVARTRLSDQALLMIVRGTKWTELPMAVCAVRDIKFVQKKKDY